MVESYLLWWRLGERCSHPGPAIFLPFLDVPPGVATLRDLWSQWRARLRLRLGHLPTCDDCGRCHWEWEEDDEEDTGGGGGGQGPGGTAPDAQPPAVRTSGARTRSGSSGQGGSTDAQQGAASTRATTMVIIGIVIMARVAIRWAARTAAARQSLRDRPCTSSEGHRWLVNCRYEPPKCGAVWCGQLACDVTVRCDCADHQPQDGWANAPGVRGHNMEWAQARDPRVNCACLLGCHRVIDYDSPDWTGPYCDGCDGEGSPCECDDRNGSTVLCCQGGALEESPSPGRSPRACTNSLGLHEFTWATSIDHCGLEGCTASFCEVPECLLVWPCACALGHHIANPQARPPRPRLRCGCEHIDDDMVSQRCLNTATPHGHLCINCNQGSNCLCLCRGCVEHDYSTERGKAATCLRGGGPKGIPDDDGLEGRPPAPHGDAELLATLQEWAAQATLKEWRARTKVPQDDDPAIRPPAPLENAEALALSAERRGRQARKRAPLVTSQRAWGRRVRSLFAASGSDFPITVEQHVRLKDIAAHREEMELTWGPRPKSRRRPGWAVAADHTPHLEPRQRWNKQWLHSAHWYDDPIFDDDAGALAWRVVEAHTAQMSRARGIGARHPESETSVYKHGHPRPKRENISFEPEDGDIFDEWLNGGDDGRQQAAWEEATAIWDREFAIGKARQMDRMFCVTESALRMLHGCAYSSDAAWLGILADVGFRGVREAG